MPNTVKPVEITQLSSINPHSTRVKSFANDNNTPHVPQTPHSDVNSTKSPSAIILQTPVAASPKPETRLKKFQKFLALREFSEETDFHGWKRVYESKSLAGQLFWVVIILGSLSAASVFCRRLIDEMQHRPIMTTISIKREESIRWPVTTICPYSHFNSDALHRLGLPTGIADHLNDIFGHAPDPYIQKQINHSLSPSQQSQLDRSLEVWLTFKHLTIQELLDKVLLNCSDVILACQTGEDYHEDCCDKLNPLRVVTAYGTCYMFGYKAEELDPNVTDWEQKDDGMEGGLTFWVQTIFADSSFQPSASLPLGDGLALFTSDEESPFDFSPIALPAGVQALVEMKSTMLEAQSDRNIFLCNKKKEYSQQRCTIGLLQNYLQSKCHCMPMDVAEQLFDPAQSRAHQCTNVTIARSCMANWIHKFGPSNWTSECLPLCNYKTLAKSVSFTDFSPELAEPFIGKKEAQKLLSLIQFNIFYPKLEQTLVVQRQNGYITYLSYVGGQLGLWVGGSLLSMLHAICFFCCACCSRKMKKEV